MRISDWSADVCSSDLTAVEMARAIAQTVTAADQADAAVHALLAARGLGGRSFSGPVAQLVSAMQNVPDVTMTQLSRTGDGTLETTLTAASVAAIDAVPPTLQTKGYDLTAQPPLTTSGRHPARNKVTAAQSE